MKILASLKRFLREDKVQRFFYLLGLGAWLLLMKDQFHKYDKESSLGIPYLSLIVIPSLLLLIQIIVNHKVLWITIFSLVLSYSVYSAYYTVRDFIDITNNPVKAVSWDLGTTLILLAVFAILVFVNWILYWLKPQSR